MNIRAAQKIKYGQIAWDTICPLVLYSVLFYSIADKMVELMNTKLQDFTEELKYIQITI